MERLTRHEWFTVYDVDTSQDISTDMITINYGQLNISIPVTADVNTIRTIMEVAVRAK